MSLFACHLNGTLSVEHVHGGRGWEGGVLLPARQMRREAYCCGRFLTFFFPLSFSFSCADVGKKEMKSFLCLKVELRLGRELRMFGCVAGRSNYISSTVLWQLRPSTRTHCPALSNMKHQCDTFHSTLELNSAKTASLSFLIVIVPHRRFVFMSFPPPIFPSP